MLGSSRTEKGETKMETRNKWEEYERRKKALGWMEPGQYAEEIQKIIQELGL